MAFHANNPDASIVPMWMPPNNRGTESEHFASPQDWCAFSITTSAEDPERIFHFLDSLTNEENHTIRRFGWEGEHFTIDENGVFENLLSEEENLAQNIGRGWLNDIAPSRKDHMNLHNVPEVVAMFEEAGTIRTQADANRIVFLRTFDRPIWNENRAELERIRDEYIWGIIAGQRPISDFDVFVELFNAAGGEAAARETEELYRQQAAELEVFLEKHGRH
jgi:hypothetical protein